MPRAPDNNPFAPPLASDSPPEAAPADRDESLRHEYLGAILLAAACGALAMVMYVVSHRAPTSDLGEAAALMTRLVSFVLAVVSLLFVLITLRAAALRVWLIVARIRRGRR